MAGVFNNPDFSTFFLDKCDSVHQRTMGEIYVEGFITIIRQAFGLEFLASEYVSIDNPPNFLVDRDTHIRMRMLHSRGDETYSWLNNDKDVVYILPSWVSDSFILGDPHNWLPPEQLTPAGVLTDSKDDEEEEDEDDDSEMPEADDHFNFHP